MNRLLVCICCGLVLCTGLQAQDLFQETTPLQMSMMMDIVALQAQRHDSAKYMSTRIRYVDAQGAQTLKGEVRPRGNFRLKEAVCAFPPLKLKVKKTERQGTLFAGHSSLKLVTHCAREDLIHKEYLAYRLYQELCPYHFKVRLAQISYIDLQSSQPVEQHWAFFIEDDDHMARRLGGEKAKDPHFVPNDLDSAILTLLHVYHYFIANMDWNVEEPKNMDFVEKEGHAPIPVPYDFDFSEWVNAPYTGLTSSFNRRRMRRICRTEAEFKTVIDLFLARKTVLFELVESYSDLPKGERNRMRRLMISFYKELQNGKFMEKCLQACPETRVSKAD